MLTLFKHLVTHSLIYHGDCKLLGITNKGFIYAEELYGDEDWLAQHKLSVADGILETVDELAGENPAITPLSLPDDLITSPIRSCCEVLTFRGARLRGIYSEERIDELVLPLTVDEKIEIVEFMEWDIEPMQIIGVAESVVLARTPLTAETYVVCRRVRIAYRLGKRVDQSYDYDSLDMYLLHEFKPKSNTVPEWVDCLNDIDDVVLLRPMDCLYHAGRLYVADGGEDDDMSAIHVFEYQEDAEQE